MGNMRNKKQSDEVKKLVKEGRKKFVRYDEGAVLYSIGLNTFRKIAQDVVNGRFCPKSVRSFCPIVAGFNAGTYKVPACVL